MDADAYLARLDDSVSAALSPWVGRAPRELLDLAWPRRAQEGEEFVHILDACKFVYVLCAGRVRSTAMASSGTSVTIDEFDAPAVFGEMEAIADSPRFHSSLVACTDCELVTIPSAAYLAWISSDAELMLARARSTTRRLLGQTGTGRNLMARPSVERLELVIFQEARRRLLGAKIQGAGEIVIKTTQPQLAERAGVSAKTVSRGLAELERRALIERRGRAVVVSADALRRLEEEVRSFGSPPTDTG